MEMVIGLTRGDFTIPAKFLHLPTPHLELVTDFISLLCVTLDE